MSALIQPANKLVSSNTHHSHINISAENMLIFKNSQRFLILSKLKKCHDSGGINPFFNDKYKVIMSKVETYVIVVAMETPFTPIPL